MKKRMFLMLGLFFLFFLIVVGLFARNVMKGIEIGKSFAPPPVSVSTYTVQTQEWKPTLDSIGSLAAVQGVQVSTDQSGIVLKVAFASGAKVQAGDVLLELDTRQDLAMLHAAQAKQALAKATLGRQKDLLGRQVAAQSEFDSADAEYAQAVASVEQVQAVLDHKIVKAPFAGVLGIRQVNEGQYFSAGTPIVSLQSLDPIYVNFSLPQQSLPAIQADGTVRVMVEGAGKEPFVGKVNALESQVDVATRNIQVQATLRNEDGRLRPGMYARVEADLPVQNAVVAVPSTSVNYAPYGNSVYVVAKMKGEKDAPEYLGAEERMVTLGPTRGDLVSVVSGLKVGDEIITGGTFRLRDKGAVEVQNSVQPNAEKAPTPPNT